MMYKTNILLQPFLLLVDIIGYFFFFWLKFMKLGEPKRILLIRLEHIGDVLMTTPTFRALRKRFPKAQIDVLVRDFAAPVVQKNKNISNVIVWNAPWLSRLGRREPWASVQQMIRKLRKNKYDVAIDFHGDPRNILFASRIARYRIGFGCRGFGFLLNKVVPYGKKHMIDRNLSLAKALGADTSDRRMELQLSPADERFAKSALKGITRPVCISIGSGKKEKNWLEERWAEVADSLIEKYNATIILTGGKGDAEIVNSLQNRIQHKEKVLNLCGKTSLFQLAAVIKYCKLLLSPDSGPVHIARTMNTPLLELCFLDDPKEWGYNEPKFQNIKRNKPGEISPDDVLQKISQMKVL
ncbi:MAG: glycosyltransferase family 9 protein [Candidatus Woesearchaeota archaeon]